MYLVVETHLITTSHNFPFMIILMIVFPSVELSRATREVDTSLMVEYTSGAGYTVYILTKHLTQESDHHSFLGAPSTGLTVQLDGVQWLFPFAGLALVILFIAMILARNINTVNVSVTSTVVGTATVATDGETCGTH